MPTYEYRCESCGHQFEHFQSMSAKPLRKCPACKKDKLIRLIGSGAGIIFKGSGFYQTDYRSESYKKGQTSEKEIIAPPEKKPEKKSAEKTTKSPKGKKKLS
jgi:putative FmdB family regulatory protein